jgi:MFS family permease
VATDPALGTSYRDVLRDREFRALLLADGLSATGDQIARIAVALLVLERSGSAFAAAATYACSYLTWLVGGPFLSGIADRYPRRRVMVVCDLLRMALIASLAAPGVPLWFVFAVLLLVGVLAPPFDAARSSLLADVLSGERYVVGNALMNAMTQGAQLVGFVGGGALVTVLDVEGALVADAGTFALSAVLLVSRVAERCYERPEPSTTSRTEEALAGFALLRRTPRLRLLLGWGLLSASVVIAPEGLAVAIAAEDGRGAVAAGVLTAAVPAGFLVGSWLVLRQPPDRREHLFPWMVAASCLPLLLTAVVQDVAVITVLWVLAGIGNALQLVANASFVQEVPQHLRGRAFGVAVTLLMAVQGVLLLVAGALAEVTGPRVPVAVLAGLGLLLVPLLVAVTPSRATTAPLSTAPVETP